MHLIRKFLLASTCCLLFSGFLTSCHTTSQKAAQLDQGLGNWKYDDVVTHFGKPVSRMNLENGDYVATWLWDQKKTYEPDQFNPKQSTFEPAPLPAVQQFAVIAFNRNNVMQSWRVDTSDNVKYHQSDNASPPKPGISNP